MYFVLHFCVERWHIGLVSYIDISDRAFQVGGWEAGKLPVRPTTFAYSRARACCTCSMCGTGGLCFKYFFYLRYPSSFSNASSFGRRLKRTEILSFGRCDPTVVVSYYRRCVAKYLLTV